MAGEAAIQTDVAIENQDVNVNVDAEQQQDIAADDHSNSEDHEGQDAEGYHALSDRDKMMKILSKKRRNQNAGLPLDHELPVEDDDTPPVELDTNQDDNGDDEVTIDDEQMVTLKVNGREIQKTQDEVDAAGGVAAIQKQIAGDLKLEQAARERKQLEADKARFGQIEEDNRALRDELTQLKNMLQQGADQGKPKLSDDELKAKAKSMADKFFVGDSADLELTMLDILKQSQSPSQASPSVDVDEVARKAADKVAEQQADREFEADLKKARSYFETDHKDLSDNPARRSFVNEMTKVILKESPEMLPTEVMKEAVKRVREDLSIPNPKASADQDLSQRNKRKQETVDIIPQANQRRQSAPTDNKPKSPKEIFKELQSKRSHQ